MSRTPEFLKEGLCLKPEATHRGTMPDLTTCSTGDLCCRFHTILSSLPPALERRGTAFSHSHWSLTGLYQWRAEVQSEAKNRHDQYKISSIRYKWIPKLNSQRDPNLIFKSYLKKPYIYIYVHIVYIYTYIINIIIYFIFIQVKMRMSLPSGMELAYTSSWK